MKKILFILVLLGSITVYATDYTKEIEKEKKGTIKFLNELSKNNSPEKIAIVTVFSADELLKNLQKYNKQFNINTIILVYPDMNILSGNIEILSNSFKNIVVYSIANDLNGKYLKNRTTKKLKNLKMIEKIKKVGNISVIESKIDKKDLNLIVPESLKIVKSKKIINKYILN